MRSIRPVIGGFAGSSLALAGVVATPWLAGTVPAVAAADPTPARRPQLVGRGPRPACLLQTGPDPLGSRLEPNDAREGTDDGSG
jgi:hypothetical protein